MTSQLFRGLVSLSHSKCLMSSAVSYSCCSRSIGFAYVKSANVHEYTITSFHTSAVDEAARRGTRARRDALQREIKKKKLETEVKKEFIPYSMRDSKNLKSPRVDYDSIRLPIPSDDVFHSKRFQWPLHTIAEAVAKHRETHHPTQYNLPNAHLFLQMELSLVTDKKNRFLDRIGGVLAMPHPFPTGQDRQVAVLTDCLVTQARVQEMGAHLVGGKEVVKMVLNGSVNMSKYDVVVSSLDILVDLVPIRGILRNKFPTPKEGTAVTDVSAAVNRFLTGLKYDATRDKFDLDYATVEVLVGTLDMPDEQLDANISAVIQDVRKQRSLRKTSDIISTAHLTCPPTRERFKLDLTAVDHVNEPTVAAPPIEHEETEEDKNAALAN